MFSGFCFVLCCVFKNILKLCHSSGLAGCKRRTFFIVYGNCFMGQNFCSLLSAYGAIIFWVRLPLVIVRARSVTFDGTAKINNDNHNASFTFNFITCLKAEFEWQVDGGTGSTKTIIAGLLFFRNRKISGRLVVVTKTKLPPWVLCIGIYNTICKLLFLTCCLYTYFIIY